MDGESTSSRPGPGPRRGAAPQKDRSSTPRRDAGAVRDAGQAHLAPGPSTAASVPLVHQPRPHGAPLHHSGGVAFDVNLVGDHGQRPDQDAAGAAARSRAGGSYGWDVRGSDEPLRVSAGRRRRPTRNQPSARSLLRRSVGERTSGSTRQSITAGLLVAPWASVRAPVSCRRPSSGPGLGTVSSGHRGDVHVADVDPPVRP